MTSHKTLKMKRAKCDADVSILDDPPPPCHHLSALAGPLPPFYADIIFPQPLVEMIWKWLKGEVPLRNKGFLNFRHLPEMKKCENGNSRNVFGKKLLPHFQKMHQLPCYLWIQQE